MVDLSVGAMVVAMVGLLVGLLADKWVVQWAGGSVAYLVETWVEKSVV